MPPSAARADRAVDSARALLIIAGSWRLLALMNQFDI